MQRMTISNMENDMNRLLKVGLRGVGEQTRRKHTNVAANTGSLEVAKRKQEVILSD